MPVESRGLFYRLRSWVMFVAIDGRAEQRARSNAPFEPRSARAFVLLALVPGLFLLLLAAALFWRPLSAEPETLSTIPIDVPAQTAVERRLIQNIVLLREGIWEARLPAWSVLPSKGMARVSNTDIHAPMAALLSDIASFGETFASRATPGAHRDRVFLGQVSDLRAQLRAFDTKLGGVRSVTAYHLGLLALWAGDAADAEPQFQSVIAIAQKTEPLDDVGRQRLAGLEAAAAYGLGLAQAGRGQWRTAMASFDSALTAACRAAALNNIQADFGFTLNAANLVPLDTRSIRNDRLVALLAARNSSDETARLAVTNPSCAQLLSPSKYAPSGDADAEARSLFNTLSVAGDPILAANLQLRAALMGDRDVVQRLAFDNGDAEAAQAQSLARAVSGIEQSDNSVDKSALADLQKLSQLKSQLAAGLGNGTLAEPESDPAWNWSDPTVFMDWKNSVASVLAAELLAKAEDVRAGNPGLAAALYGLVLDNSAWFSTSDVVDAWWRLNTGISLAFALSLLAMAAALSAGCALILSAWRKTYRTTFESYHHDDRVRAPEG